MNTSKPLSSEPDSKLVDALWVGVFRQPMNAFYAPLACSLNFVWSTDEKTAAVDGKTIFYNPEFFTNLKADQRLFVFMHEVDHVARMHHVRRGNRDPQVWNQACDIEINNELLKTRDPKNNRLLYDMEGVDLLFDHDYDDWSAEEIYDDLIQKNKETPEMPMSGDMSPVMGEEDISPNEVLTKVVNAKISADQTAKGVPGSVPGFLDRLIKTFGRPLIPWKRHLTRFMTELTESDYSWQRRNVRYQDAYVPALVPVDGLAHIVFFYDVSGSVTKNQITRFNTEVAHIHKYFSPSQLTIITFDTEIHETYTFHSEETLSDIEVSGGGGTSLQPVHDWLVKNKPTAAIIFTDLECYSIPDPKVPILWGITGNSMYFDPPFGTKIRIPTEDTNDY